MTAVATVRSRLGPKPGFRSVAPERRRRRRVQLVWAMLVLNVLTFFPDSRLILPIPGPVGKLIAQGSLLLGALLILTVNRPARVRPSVYIFLATLLVSEAVIAATVNGAAALALADSIGQLAPGFSADLALFEIDDVGELPYWYGDRRCLGTWVRGKSCHPSHLQVS